MRLTDHDGEYDCAHDNITKQTANGSAVYNGGGSSEEKAGTDGHHQYWTTIRVTRERGTYT